MGEEGREPGTHCSCMWQVSLVTCMRLSYIKINRNLCLPAEGHTADLYCLRGTFGGFEVKNNIALTLTVCITSFKMIGKLQRDEIGLVTCQTS